MLYKLYGSDDYVVCFLLLRLHKVHTALPQRLSHTGFAEEEKKIMARDMFDTFAACAAFATLLIKLKVMCYWAADSQDQKPSGELLSLSHSMIHAIDKYRACAVSLSIDSLPLQSGYLLGGSMTLSKDD